MSVRLFPLNVLDIFIESQFSIETPYIYFSFWTVYFSINIFLHWYILSVQFFNCLSFIYLGLGGGEHPASTLVTPGTAFKTTVLLLYLHVISHAVIHRKYVLLGWELTGRLWTYIPTLVSNANMYVLYIYINVCVYKNLSNFIDLSFIWILYKIANTVLQINVCVTHHIHQDTFI